MAISRKSAALSLAKGLLAAVLATLVLMAALAAAAVFLRVSDGLVMVLNRLIKLTAILFGATVAVGPGGDRGFFTGMALAILYMSLGYALYAGLGGNAFIVTEMLGEILIGAAIGAIAGAVLANMRPSRRARG